MVAQQLNPQLDITTNRNHAPRNTIQRKHGTLAEGQRLPPKSPVVAADVKAVGRHTMGVGGRGRAPSREESELSVPLPRPAPGRRAPEILDPMQDKVGTFRPQSVAEGTARLPQKCGLAMPHRRRRHAGIELRRTHLDQRSQQRCKIAANPSEGAKDQPSQTVVDTTPPYARSAFSNGPTAPTEVLWYC